MEESLKQFHSKSGTWQGCPASPFLFKIMLEALAGAVRQEKGIKWPQIWKEFKLSLFEDDVTSYVRDRQTLSFWKHFLLLETIEKYSAMAWMQDTESTRQTNCFPIHQQSTYRDHEYHPILNSLKGNNISKNKPNQGGDRLLTWKF